MQNLTLLKLLSLIYFVIFLVSVFFIFLMHTFPTPFLDFARLPTFLRLVNPFLGNSWPLSLRIYQGILITFLFVILIDSISLYFSSSKSLRTLSAISSYFGYALMIFVGLFFVYALLFFSYSELTIRQASFYMGVAMILLILDVLTFVIDEEGLIKFKLKRN